MSNYIASLREQNASLEADDMALRELCISPGRSSTAPNMTAAARDWIATTRSGAGRASRSRCVVTTPRRRLAPTMPAGCISRAIRFLPTAWLSVQLRMRTRHAIRAARGGVDRAHLLQ
jgi:hypothetical protein